MEGEKSFWYISLLKAKHILLRLLNSFWNKNCLASERHKTPVFFSWSLQVQFSLFCNAVLVCSSHYVTKNTIDWAAETTKTYFSRFWRLSSPRSRFWQSLYLMRALFLICPGSHPLVLHLIEGRERAQTSSLVSFLIKTLSSFMRAPP